MASVNEVRRSEVIDARRLTVYFGDGDRHKGESLKSALIELLMKDGISGATVLHAQEGFGASKQLHTSRILDLSADLPVMIIAIDRADKIERLVPKIEAMMQHGAITVENVRSYKPLLDE